MKISKTFLIICFCFSLKTHACPDISGNFKGCTSENYLFSTAQFNVSQTLKNGVSIFKLSELDEDTGLFEDSILKADNNRYVLREGTVESRPAEFTFTTTSCTVAEVIVRMQLVSDNNIVADVKTKYSKMGNIMSQKISGEIYGEEFTTTAICK